MLRLIALCDRSLGIAAGGRQPVHIGADLRRFRQLTLGGTVVMGRVTQEALPKGCLPGRRNIVLSRGALQPVPPGVEVAGSLAEALALIGQGGKAWVIGGAQIYRLFFDLVEELWLTEVATTFAGADRFLPPLDGFWLANEGRERLDEGTQLTYRHNVWLRG